MTAIINSLLNPSPDPSSIWDVINEETVKTPEGRKRYFDFLTQHSNIKPIQKIYGLKPPLECNNEAIQAHVKRLYICIHPDKVPLEERGLCTELFKLVHQAEEACMKKSTEQASILTSNVWTFVGSAWISELGSPVFWLKLFIEQGKWVRAKEMIDKIGPHIGSNPKLPILASIVFVRRGDLDSAIQHLPSELKNTIAILKNYRDTLKNTQKESSLSSEEKIKLLLASLKDMQDLKEVYQRESQHKFPYPEVFDHIIPHHLFIPLKEYSYLLNKDFDYERYLREAIRYCPDGLQKEKQLLIEELKQWLIQKDGPKAPETLFRTDQEMDKQKARIYQKVADILMQLGEVDRKFIEPLIHELIKLRCEKQMNKVGEDLKADSQNLFRKHSSGRLPKNFVQRVARDFFNLLIYFRRLLLTTLNIPCLKNNKDPQRQHNKNQEIQHLDHVIKEMKDILKRRESIFSYFAKVYPPEIEDSIKTCLFRLQGIKAYIRGEKNKAAHYFLQASDDVCLGLVQVDLYRYADAIRSWGQAQQYVESDTTDYIFKVMNLCDILYVAEEANFARQKLGLLDEKQLEVLKSKRQKN